MNDLLYSEVKGSGHHVVLLHGWGMHGGLWGKFRRLLSAQFQTHTLDLPGYGFSSESKSEFTLNALTESVEKYIKELNEPVSLIGWSLGGLIALNIANRNKIQIKKLVLIAATPCFTKKDDWHHAMEPSVFNDFSKELALDYKKTLKRFLSLQTRGSDLAREDLRELNRQLGLRGEPDINALKTGLEILSATDLRKNKNTIQTMVVLGEKDTLVPLAVKDELKIMLPNSEQFILEKTGHAPFISQPELCADKIKNFINE